MEDTTPTGQPRSTRKAGLVGGALGSIGLAVSIFALSATAGAAGPVLQADAEPAPVEDVAEGEIEISEEDYAAADACWGEIEATFNLDGDVDEDAIDWDAIDEAAEECEALLPQEIQDQIAADEAAWAPYEECIDAAFEASGIDVDAMDNDVFVGDIDGEFAGEAFAMDDFGTAVSIMDGDEFSFAEFGEGDGTITITKAGDDITVSTDGDVDVETVDWDEEAVMLDAEELDMEDFEIEDFDGEGEVFLDDMFDAELDDALSGCDDKLPEGIDLDADFEDGFAVAVEVEPLELTEG